jgi:hypothetical protein
MLKLEGARRAASRMVSRTSAGIYTASNTFTARLFNIGSISPFIAASMLLLQHTSVAVAT